MAACPHCNHAVEPHYKRCPNCGGELGARASAAAPSAIEAYRSQVTTWIQANGPVRVGLGLIGLSFLTFFWSSQRGIWGAGLGQVALALVVAGYLSLREFAGQDPLAGRPWAPAVAAGYLFVWGLTSLTVTLGNLLYVPGSAILAWHFGKPWYTYAKGVGLDWRHGLYGYRRALVLGALLALAALCLTWIPASRTSGWWSGGYSYSSYYGRSTYQPFQWYNPGFYFPAWKGFRLTGSVLMLVGLFGSLFYAAFAPQFATNRWYLRLPLLTAIYGVCFVFASGTLYWGQLFFLVGIGLVGWAGYQLGVKGEAEGPGDLRQVPVERWLSRWM
jgi:hypothetical protein